MTARRPFDPRDFPDPLTVRPEPVRRPSRRSPTQASGCIVAILVGVLLVGSNIGAAPRPAAVTLAPTGESPRRPEAPHTASSPSDPASSGSVSEVGSDAPYPADPRVSSSGASPAPRTSDSPPASGIRGTATWYCSGGRHGSPVSACTIGYGPDDLVAAIDTDTGFRRGDRVRVTYRVSDELERSVVVRIVDVCGCPGRRAIDLTIAAFEELAAWPWGVLPVRLERVGRSPRLTLPPTDGAP